KYSSLALEDQSLDHLEIRLYDLMIKGKKGKYKLIWNRKKVCAKGFNESGKYKKTFISSGVGTGSMQVLHGFKFEVELLTDHTFKWRRFKSLTFNNTVACEVISKWKAGLKDDMDAWSDAEIWAAKGLLDKVKGNVLGIKIVKNQSGNTIRVSQSRFYNGKLVQTLLKGHSILSLEGSLSRDCDVEKNGKWSCIYVVGSHEYQMVCTRLDIGSADVGMLDKFDHGLQTDVQVFVDFDYAMRRSITIMAGYMTFTEAWKKEIWLKGLLTESRYELRLVAGIAIGTLVKGCSRSELLAQVKVVAYWF
ncbi:hypothetical protein Tco_1147827, partial [Tanacetum coccineum]